MEWVRALQRAHRLGTSARRYLRRHGITDEAEAVQPFCTNKSRQSDLSHIELANVE